MPDDICSHAQHVVSKFLDIVFTHNLSPTYSLVNRPHVGQMLLRFDENVSQSNNFGQGVTLAFIKILLTY